MAVAAGSRRAESPAREEAPARRRRFGLSFEGRMMAPALIILALLSLLPFLYIVAMSLSRVGLIGGISLHWAGLDNWTRLFSDSSVGASWFRSAIYFIATVGLEM